MAALGVTLAVGHPGPSFAQTWNMYGGTGTVFVPYANATSNASLNDSPSLNLGFNGSASSARFTMDTGSVGIVASPNFFTPAAGAQNLGPGHQIYSSSGVVENGTWYSSTEDIRDATGKVVATAGVPVLQVTSITCTAHARNCSPNFHPTDVALMGIGFARESPQQQHGTPGYNSFLNLTSVASNGSLAPLPATWRNGYVVTPTGVYLGLTAANTASAAFVKLAPWTTYSTATLPEWMAAPMSISVNGVSGSGNVLMDTGVGTAFLSLPPGATAGTLVPCPGGSPVECAPAGTTVAISLPGQSSPVAFYTFTVGQSGNPMQPDAVDIAGDPSGTFFNTSRHVLGGIDFIYDNTGGFIGYQWNGGTTGAFGFVNPALALQGTVSTGNGFFTNIPVVLTTATTLSQSGTGTFAAPISGGGSLEIASGAVLMTASNPYVGATTIDPGATLALSGAGSIAASAGVATNGTFDISGATSGASITTLSGSGAVNLGSRTLTLTNASGTFGGALADGGLGGGIGGGLTVAAGTQTLNGTNTYTGPTTINAGAVLSLAGAGSIARSSGVAANGTLDISGTTAGASISSLSGVGAVNLGGQTLTLTNAAGTFAGRIGGSGGFVVGGGTQALSGNNTYTGGTTISGGATLAIATDGALAGANGPVTLSDGTLLALSSFSTGGSIVIGSGGGTVNVGQFALTSAGALEVNGPFVAIGSIALGGNAAINSGTTSINGDLTASALLVAGAATLRGTGNIHAPTLVEGRLAPGNSPGTMTFTAPVTLAPHAVSQFDIDGTGTGTGAGNFSRVIVTGVGNAYSAAGALAPLLRGITGSATNSYTPPIGQTFTVVSGQGGLSGSFAGLTQPAGLAPGTRFDALYAPTTLTLVVTPAAYGNLGLAGLSESANQTAVGTTLDAARPPAGVAMSTSQSAIYAPLYLLPATAIAPVLEQLSPTIYGDALMVARDNWYLVTDAISERLAARRGSRTGDQAQILSAPDDRTIWLTGLGQFGNVYSNGTSGYSSSSGGVAAGVDMPLNSIVIIGAAFGFTNQVTSAKNAASFTGDAFQFGLYGSLRQGIAFLDLQAGGLFSEGTARRPLGAYDVQAKGNTNGSAGGGSMRGGVRLDAGDWQLEPSLTLAGVSLNQGSLTETQAGPAGLSIASASVGSLQTLLGTRAERRIVLGDNVTLVPSVQIGWLHEYLDTRGSTQAAFIGAPGVSFGVQSAPVGRDAAVIGLHAALDLNGPLAVYASYIGTLNASSNAQTVSAGLRIVW